MLDIEFTIQEGKLYMLQCRVGGRSGRAQVRIAVEAVAPSFVDLLYARGGYQLKPVLPGIPGSEFCGMVERIGPGVADARLVPGTRVAAPMPSISRPARAGTCASTRTGPPATPTRPGPRPRA